MQVFRPKPSRGWVSLVALGVLLIADAVFVLILGATSRQPPPAFVAAIEVGIGGLGVYFLVLAAMFPTMRYEVRDGELRLRYGPMSWRVRLADIREVRRTDLQWSPWSSMRFPGFALFNVPYGGGMGTVRMCATRSRTDILLLDTGDVRYGVTPEDEEGFLNALGRRLSPSPEAAEMKGAER